MDNQKHHKSTHVNSQTPIQSPSQTPIQTPSQTPIQTPIPTQSQIPIQTPSQSPIQSPTQTPFHTPIQHNTTVQSTEQSKPAKEIVVIFEIDNNYNSQIQDYRQQQQINYLQQLSQTLQQQSPPQSEAAASNDVEMTSHEDPIMEQVEETDDAMEIDRFCIPYEKIKDQLNTAEEDENMNNAGDFLSNWPSLRELIIRIPCLTAIADYGQLFSTLLIKNPLSNLVNSYKECDLSRFYFVDWQSERYQLYPLFKESIEIKAHISCVEPFLFDIFENLIESFITLINMSVPVSGTECGTVPGTLSDSNYLQDGLRLTFNNLEGLIDFGYNDSSVSHYFANGNIFFYTRYPVPVHFYFTYSDCNKTYDRDLSLNIPNLEVTQPNCLFTNATVTHHTTTIYEYYYVYDPFTSKTYKYQPGSVPMTMTFPVYGVGSYRVNIGLFTDNNFFGVQVTPQHDLIPQITLTHTNYSIDNGIVKIENLNQFTDIQLTNASGANIAASSSGQFTGLASGTYYIIAQSQLCGTQSVSLEIEVISPIPIVNLIPTQCATPTFDVNVTVSLEGISDDQVTYQFNGNQYQAGDVHLLQPSDYTFTFAIQGGYSFIKVLKIPRPVSSELPLTYSIDHPLSCLSNSAVLFINYTGDYQDIKVNGEVIAANFRRNVNYGDTYSITKECSSFNDILNFPFATPNVQFFTDDFNYATCYSNFTVTVSNYELFNSMVLVDKYNNINYTAVDGTFKKVRATDILTVFYTEKGCQNEQSFGFELPIARLEQSDYRYEISNADFNGCTSQVATFTPVVFGRRYDDAAQNVTFRFGVESVDIPSSYYYCKEYNFSDTPLYPNMTKIKFNSVTCQESLTALSFESKTTISNVYVDDWYYANPSDAKVTGGNHTVTINYGSCTDLYQIYVPYTKFILIFEMSIIIANVLSYNVVPQSATNCSFETGAIYFNNMNEYTSLIFGGDEISNVTALSPDRYLFSFNHTVCGLGRVFIDVPMEGSFKIETFIEPYYNLGYLKYSINDSNGVEITPESVSTPLYHYSMAHLIGDISDSYVKGYLSSGDYCKWNFEVTYDENSPKWNENQLTIDLISTPSKYFDGIATVTDALKGVMHQNEPRSFNRYEFISKNLSLIYGVKSSTYFFTIYNQRGLTTLITMKLPDSYPNTQLYIGKQSVPSNSFQTNAFLQYSEFYSKSKGALLVEEGGIFSTASYAPYPTVTIGNPTCLGGDGFLTISNPDPNYIYRLYTNMAQGEPSLHPEISDGTYLNFTDLSAGSVYINVVNKDNYMCTNQYSTDIMTTEFTTTYTVKNQCVAGRNGSVVLSSFYGNKAADAIYTLNGVQVSNSLSLGVGNYSIVSDVASGTCKFALQTLFTVESNIISSTINSPSCGTINIVSTASLNDSLTLELLYSSNNSVITTLKNTNRYTFNNLNGADYLVRITEISGCQSTTPVTVNDCQVPTTTTATSTTTATTSSTTSDPINNSSRVIPPILLFFIEMKYLNCILLLFCVGNFLNHVHGNECDTVPGTLQYFNSLTSRVSLVYTDSEDLLGFGYNDSSVSHFYQDGLVKFYATQPVAVHFYFMYSECNRTYNIDFSDNLILTYHVEDHFSDISYSFNVGSNISFPVTGFGGYKVIIDYPMGDTDFSVLVLPESDKVPLISLSHSNYSIGNGAIQIQNLNQFTNVQLINSSGVNIAASAPGQYSGLVSGTYYLSAVSNECGTQYIPLTIKPIYPNPIVNLVASQCGQPSMGVNMSITLEGVPDDQVTYQFNGNQYQAGEILNILPNEYFFSFNINNDQYYFNTFVLIPNPITKELPLTYSIDHPLSCLSDSAVLFINYTGDYQDIKVNGEVIASNFKRNVNYGETYSITKECSTFQDSIAFPFAEPIIEYYTEDFNYANCFSNFTVIVSNYQLFTTLVLSDQYSNINYTSVDGSFKNVRASNTFAVYYQEKGCQKEATYTFTIDINPVEPSDIHFELSNNQFDGCVDQFGSFTPIVFGRRYDDAVVNTTFTLDIYSALEIIPPYYFCREFNFYTPSPRPNLSTVDFDSVVCQESLTKVRVNSSVHVYSIGVDSNTFTDIDKTVVSGGNHSIFVNYGSCSDVFEVYVPYTKGIVLNYPFFQLIILQFINLLSNIIIIANVISYNVVPQSATNCSFPTAAIYFNNLNDFISLSIEGEDVTNATDIYPGTFLFNFNHSVCGLGEFSVIVGMDGTFEIETFVEPYYGYGLLKYTILDNNGSEITPTLVQGYNHYPFAHLIGDITDARATSFLSKGNFCRWMFDVSYDPQDPRWVEDPLTLNLTNEPLPYVDGFASVTDVLEGKPHQIQPYVSGSGFINRELTQVYGVQDSTSLNVYYNSKNYRINLDVPYTESITDLFEPVSYNCKNLEIVMKLSDSNTDYEMFLDNEKVDTNSFKMSVFLDSPLYYKKSSGVLKIQQNAPFGINSFAPYPTITYGNPTCLGKDGFVAITNPDPDYIYRAYFNIEGDNRNLPEISDGTYLNFTGLDSGNIVIAVVSRYNYLCTNSFDFDLKATEFTTTYNVKNQCVAGRNGSVVLSSFYGTKAADAIYTLNGVQVSNSLSLGIGNYSIVSDVASGTCKFALQTLFTVESNIISSTINSPSCGTINIVSTASLNDSLTLELLYSSNNSVITTLKNTNRYTFNNLNGADYLVRITEISGCQSTTPVTVNECQVPTTTTTTSSTTSDPINNSNRVIPSLLLFIIVLLVLLN
ncbi:hypothetical protein PPL_01045 [Heterostelium album PN500]|uniref:Uncharacterized protein n=1 Tax=Heterostelium pallidum (strain ATCC 26659 / Pp 5 / PN500) TaxID=670386 RepID=D3AXY7_HETP5|nr:hypothetical protein PPL_01045 [Heterostelium album PN500]EFA85814.1 hypothetical protein PPL_01045 [Heterostelium album PN500]|eukprot:XP_020437920.1 hypothetical protein PPL_01045 [Heterostelium album PN500]